MDHTEFKLEQKKPTRKITTQTERPVNTLCTVPHLLVERRYERGWKSNTKALESWKFSFTTIEVQITQARYEFHLFIALLLSGFPSWNNHILLFNTDFPRRKPSTRQRWMLGLFDTETSGRTCAIPEHPNCPGSCGERAEQPSRPSLFRYEIRETTAFNR